MRETAVRLGKNRSCPNTTRISGSSLVETLREHADKLARRPPNAHLMAEAANLPPGRALDAGCGHGAETLWLAAHGWQVTAVDFSRAALAHGRSMAEAFGADVAARVEWIESDLASWSAEPGHYDLVVCLYVHVAGSVEDMVARMADGVAPGGTLFLVGHRPIDPGTGAATAAANQVQVSVEVRSQRSLPTCGSWSSPRSVRASSPARVSMP